MLSKNHALKALSLIVLLFTLPQTVLAKSVYVITDTDGPEAAAYEIQGTSLAYQTNYVCEADWGAVGLAIDGTRFLFVTFEAQNVIEVVNARTMIYEENPVQVPQAASLAGIAFDDASPNSEALSVWDIPFPAGFFLFLWKKVIICHFLINIRGRRYGINIEDRCPEEHLEGKLIWERVLHKTGNYNIIEFE